MILNLIINAVEAMGGVRDGPRELLISTGQAESGGVLVAVRDSGPGLAPATLEHLFEAFYTTKTTGLGWPVDNADPSAAQGPKVRRTLCWREADSNFKSLSESVPLAPGQMIGKSRADGGKILEQLGS